ncbi:MAG: putative inorganic carbon transporter subunit DabA [Pirellulales bacterium]
MSTNDLHQSVQARIACLSLDVTADIDPIAAIGLGTRGDLFTALIQVPEIPCNLDPDVWIEGLIEESVSSTNGFPPIDPSKFRVWLESIRFNGTTGQSAIDTPDAAEYLKHEVLARSKSFHRPEVLRSAYQNALWWCCKNGTRNWQPPFTSGLQSHGETNSGIRAAISRYAPCIDDSIRRVLVPQLSSFVDPSPNKWEPHDRAACFLRLFAEVYGPRQSFVFHRSRTDRELAVLLSEHQDLEPCTSIQRSLDALQLAEIQATSYLEELIQVVRGWSGLLNSFRDSNYPCTESVRRFSIAELLAVLLLLDRVFIAEQLGCETDCIRVEDWSRTLERKQFQSTRAQLVATRQTWIYRVACHLNWSPERLHALQAADWSALQHELNGYSDLDRRFTAQEAFESDYRRAVCGKLEEHASQFPLAESRDTPEFLVITCAEPNQESIRRHIESICPQAETVGTAGFFNLDITVKDHRSHHFLPRAPANVRKRHKLAENDLSSPATYFTSFRDGSDANPIHAQSQADSFVSPNDAQTAIGFTVSEMSAVVAPVLIETGIIDRLPRLVIVMGHESSSVNNLYESADNCTFCSKESVHANVRAFVQMANDTRVRDALNADGVTIPQSSFFVGAIHDTCSDELIFLIPNEIPLLHAEQLQSIAARLRQAAQLNAEERCKELNAGPKLLGAAASAHCIERQQSGAYALPEAGLMGNALCIFGRRELTRALDLNRRAFLFSYDSIRDDDELSGLARMLTANLPIAADICFDYWFSKTSPQHFGAGRKAELTVVAKLAAANDSNSDLRIGLPWEMVQRHEPMRLLVLLDAPHDAILRMLDRHPRAARFFLNGHLQLGMIDAGKVHMWRESLRRF